MDKKEIIRKTKESIQELEYIDNNISILELAIYQKNIEMLTKQVQTEVIEFLEQQAKNYNQRKEKHQDKINLIIKKYNEQIDRIVGAYDELYINIFKIMQNAKDNQKIDITNIVILTEKLRNEDITDIEKEKINNTILACAQKKLNYAVIIDECNARLKWCIENVQKDIREIFLNSNSYSLPIRKESMISRIKQLLSNKISGKKRYEKFLTKYEKKHIRDIIKNNNVKILDVLSVLKGVEKQMENAKNQIAMQYNQMTSS